MLQNNVANRTLFGDQVLSSFFNRCTLHKKDGNSKESRNILPKLKGLYNYINYIRK